MPGEKRSQAVPLVVTVHIHWAQQLALGGRGPLLPLLLLGHQCGGLLMPLEWGKRPCPESHFHVANHVCLDFAYPDAVVVGFAAVESLLKLWAGWPPFSATPKPLLTWNSRWKA